MTLEELRTFKPQIQALARQYKIDPDSIRVFGSVARGDQGENSDVDFLVHLLPECSLLDLGGFLHGASQLTRLRTDVACDTGIKARFFKAIQDDVVFL